MNSLVERIGKRFLGGFLSARTKSLLGFDVRRFRTRVRHGRRAGVQPKFPRLHLGCGSRRVDGWVNVDVSGSDFDVDLGSGRLPWISGAFDAVVAQQVIEHLDLTQELIPLLKEVRRVCQDGAEIWLSCPDMARVCRSYLEHRGADLVEDRRTRFPDFTLGGIPPQHMVNVLFHQSGQHKNLFDLDLLCWTLHSAGFHRCRRVAEADLLKRFPNFPVRGDDYPSLYVTAVADEG